VPWQPVRPVVAGRFVTSRVTIDRGQLSGGCTCPVPRSRRVVSSLAIAG
jgi:hypothetical protein